MPITRDQIEREELYIAGCAIFNLRTFNIILSKKKNTFSFLSLKY